MLTSHSMAISRKNTGVAMTMTWLGESMAVIVCGPFLRATGVYPESHAHKVEDGFRKSDIGALV